MKSEPIHRSNPSHNIDTTQFYNQNPYWYICMKEQEINFEVKSQEERTNKLLALNTEFKNKIKLYLASQGISENAYWMRPNPTIFNFCIITCTKETAELIQQMPEVGHIEEAHGFQAN